MPLSHSWLALGLGASTFLLLFPLRAFLIQPILLRYWYSKKPAGRSVVEHYQIIIWCHRTDCNSSLAHVSFVKRLSCEWTTAAAG